jgi:hypothetical protein
MPERLTIYDIMTIVELLFVLAVLLLVDMMAMVYS